MNEPCRVQGLANRLAYEEIMSGISLINEPCPGTPFGINDYRKFK